MSDIIKAIELIDDFTSMISDYKEYSHDFKTQSAVERQLGIIGEAVNKFDKEFPDEPLAYAKKIVGFRYRLIHAYDAVDPAMIWTIVRRYLPPLKSEVRQKLRTS